LKPSKKKRLKLGTKGQYQNEKPYGGMGKGQKEGNCG